MKKNKEPSRLRTYFEVWRFRLSSSYIIPNKYHYNMLRGIGCDRKWLKRYIESKKNIYDKAVLRAINEKESIAETDFFIDWVKNAYVYCITYEKAYIDAYGVPFMLKNGLDVSKKAFEDFFINFNMPIVVSSNWHLSVIDKLTKYEDVILKRKNAILTDEYIRNNSFKIENIDLLFEYNNVLIFKHMCPVLIKNSQNPQVKDFVSKVIQQKNCDIVTSFVLYPIDYEQSMLIVKRCEWDVIEPYVRSSSYFLTEKILSYIALTVNDKFFNRFMDLILEFDCIKCTLPKQLAQRLFRPENKECLERLIESNNVWYDTFDEDLFKLGNDELSLLYLEENKHVSSNGAMYILQSKNMKVIKALLEQSYSIGYYAETYLIKNFQDELIDLYLQDKEFCEFGEAIFIKFGSKELVMKYFTKLSINALNFRAILEREDDDLINRYLLETPFFYKSSEYLCIFFEKAPYRIITEFFETVERYDNKIELPSSWNDENKSYNECIFKNTSKIYQDFFVENFALSDIDEVVMVKEGNIDTVLLYITKNELGMEALQELFKRKNKTLIIKYIEVHEAQIDIGEQEMLELFDEELLKIYEKKFGFSNTLIQYRLGL